MREREREVCVREKERERETAGMIVRRESGAMTDMFVCVERA